MRRRPGPGAYLRVLSALIRKDIRLELRTLDTLAMLLVFSLILLLTFGLALNPVERNLEDVFPGIYWLGIVFAAVIALGRGFGREREAGTLEALALLPVDRSVVYVAKVVVGILWLGLATCLMTPLFFILLDIERRPPWGHWALITLAGVAGIVVTGTLLAGMATHLRGADLLLPLLLLPLNVPVLIAAVRLTEAILEGRIMAGEWQWFRLLVGYDIVFFVVSLALFDAIVEV